MTTSRRRDSNSVLDDDDDVADNESIGHQSAEINLELQPYHFVGGQLNLRCTARIPGISYERSNELQLGSVREPVPARGERLGNDPNCFYR